MMKRREREIDGDERFEMDGKIRDDQERRWKKVWWKGF
jgi:hypothetical protein